MGAAHSYLEGGNLFNFHFQLNCASLLGTCLHAFFSHSLASSLSHLTAKRCSMSITPSSRYKWLGCVDEIV
jgi:hypothetical protein